MGKIFNCGMQKVKCGIQNADHVTNYYAVYCMLCTAAAVVKCLMQMRKVALCQQCRRRRRADNDVPSTSVPSCQ